MQDERRERGRPSLTTIFRFPHSGLSAHISVFPINKWFLTSLSSTVQQNDRENPSRITYTISCVSCALRDVWTRRSYLNHCRDRQTETVCLPSFHFPPSSPLSRLSPRSNRNRVRSRCRIDGRNYFTVLIYVRYRMTSWLTLAHSIV